MNPPNVPGPNSIPPNVPGGGGLPPNVPPGMPGGSGGSGVPPYVPPPAKAGGGLFTGRNIVIGLVALLLLCVCACGGTFLLTGGALANVFTQVAAPSAVGVQFMAALAAGDDSTAYGLCTPALKTTLGSAASLSKRIDDADARPTAWTFSSTNLNNDRLDLSGTATFNGGRTGTVSLVISKLGNDWKVDGFKLTPQ